MSTLALDELDRREMAPSLNPGQAFGDTHCPWYNSPRLTQLEKEGRCKRYDEAIRYDPRGGVSLAWRWTGLFSRTKAGSTICCRADGYTCPHQDAAPDVYGDTRLDTHSDGNTYANHHTYSDRHTHAGADRYTYANATHRYTRAHGDLYPGTAHGDLHPGAAHAHAATQLSLLCGGAK